MIMKKLSFHFILALLPLMASADVVVIDDINYNLNTTDNTAEVADLTGREIAPCIYDGLYVNDDSEEYDVLLSENNDDILAKLFLHLFEWSLHLMEDFRILYYPLHYIFLPLFFGLT